MQRRIFTEDHESFRKTIRDFIAKEVAPVYHDWEKQGHPPREFYNRLGELGVLGIEAPEEVGGGGVSDFTPTANGHARTSATTCSSVRPAGSFDSKSWKLESLTPSFSSVPM